MLYNLFLKNTYIVYYLHRLIGFRAVCPKWVPLILFLLTDLRLYNLLNIVVIVKVSQTFSQSNACPEHNV